MTTSAYYGNADDAQAAVETLRDFGLRAVCIATTIADVREGTEHVQWEVIALDLPKQPSAPRPGDMGQSVESDPADTELDEYWKGTSRWDEQWERDQERRDGYD